MKRIAICVLGTALAAGCGETGGDLDSLPSGQQNAAVVSVADVSSELNDMVPRKTRAGTLRFTSDLIQHPAARDALVARLQSQRDDADVRAALVDAIRRSGGEFEEPLAQHLSVETDARVRTVIMGALRQVDTETALDALARGLRDADPSVRAEAARVIGGHRQGARLLPALAAKLTDSTVSVQAAAARSLGILGAKDAVGPLSAALNSDSEAVQLAALRAIQRIDPAVAKHQVQLRGDLNTTQDVRLRSLVRSITDSN